MDDLPQRPVIVMQGVSKIYGAPDAADAVAVRALSDIDLLVEQGEFLAVMGPSGSGKSTLMNIMGCLDRPSAGSYTIEGRESGRLTDDELARLRRHAIGFVFQTFNLLPRLTALANVELPMIYGGLGSGARRDRAAELLRAVGLGARMTHRPNQLSGGERQRVAIARALANGPSLLLADEPTGNLDSQAGEEIMRLLDELHEQGRTIVLITHEPEMAAHAERIVKLHDGRLCA